MCTFTVLDLDSGVVRISLKETPQLFFFLEAHLDISRELYPPCLIRKLLEGCSIRGTKELTAKYKMSLKAFHASCAEG